MIKRRRLCGYVSRIKKGSGCFYVADNGQGFEARARKRAGKREHLLPYSLGIKRTGNRKIYIPTESFIYTLFQ